MSFNDGNNDESLSGHVILLRDVDFGNLTGRFNTLNLSPAIFSDDHGYQHIVPKRLEVNSGLFTSQVSSPGFPDVTVVKHETDLRLSCSCIAEVGKLCEHQIQVVTAIVKRDDLNVFFNEKRRHEKLRKVAAEYGMEDETYLDRFFQVVYQNKKILVRPYSASLFPVDKETMDAMFGLTATVHPSMMPPGADERQKVFVVLRQHKYYGYLFVELYRGEVTRGGKVRNPLTEVSPLELVWQTEDHECLKFYSAVTKFQNHVNAKREESDMTALRAIVKNAPGYDFYYLDKNVSDNVTTRSVCSTDIRLLPGGLQLTVQRHGAFYHIEGFVTVDGISYDIKDLQLRFGYFLEIGGNLYLADNLPSINLIELLKKKEGKLLVHFSKYKEIKSRVLNKLEDIIDVEYRDILPATDAQLEEQGFIKERERILYLSDFGQHVMIIPVLRYGEAEVPVRTKRQIYGTDDKGHEFLVKRDNSEEDSLVSLLIRQHPELAAQLDNDLYYFYLHKKIFLDEEWFLNVFEEWQNNGITVLGFNELEKNKLSPNKVKVNIKVLSGENWFNAVVDVRFGKKKASLKQLLKAVRSKSKYVQLDDGTKGILPTAWIEKFAAYFQAGEIVDDEMLGIAKVNYCAVEKLYDEEMLDEAVKKELSLFDRTLGGFESVKEVAVPADFRGTLRQYQKEGLNWLNFLDDLGFGGCLADDMGLGKSVQILAFILSLRLKARENTNLIVVPASLIFNWENEVARFAPSVRVLTLYGPNRKTNASDFGKYEIILTSYTTLLSDISFLKHYQFHYIFLDESQAIKNPESQRYKAVRLLKSRNKIVITGTPLENNTFDLYGQLSFACPGLLGSKQHFCDIYSIPVDRFKDSKRAKELQDKIRPFILRRTKQLVATELPDKTEMVLYCHMKTEQRRMYDAYEKEFRDYISATSNDEIAKSPMNVLRGLTRLRQICDSPLLLKGEKLKGEESAKIDVLIEQIETKSLQHKILVFSQFVTMLDLIRTELESRDIRLAYLTGSTRNRGEVVNSFQDDPEIRVFLISLKAGGTGLNLTEADYVYLVEPWWNPAVENQAIDRSHRIGQDKKVVAVRLICPETVEEKMMKLQENKRKLADNLVRADASLVHSLSKDELLALLS